jgi:F-type H+-transporting ATPase subunit epsilon
MAEKIQLEIVTPTGPVVSEEIDIVTAPGTDGDFGVLAGHAPLLSTIKIGTLVYQNDKQSHVVMVNGGFCEVSNNKITFLVESAERGAEIDVDRAMRAKERAEKRLAGAERQQENMDTTRAEASLQRAIARMKAGEK